MLYVTTVLHRDETKLQVLKDLGQDFYEQVLLLLYQTSGSAEQHVVLYEYQPSRKMEYGLFSRPSLTGCVRMAARGTTSCRRTFRW